MGFFFHRNQEATIIRILSESVSLYIPTAFFSFLVSDFYPYGFFSVIKITKWQSNECQQRRCLFIFLLVSTFPFVTKFCMQDAALSVCLFNNIMHKLVPNALFLYRYIVLEINLDCYFFQKHCFNVLSVFDCLRQKKILIHIASNTSRLLMNGNTHFVVSKMYDVR